MLTIDPNESISVPRGERLDSGALECASRWRHQEELMDESLDQTFPASDPAPASHVD